MSESGFLNLNASSRDRWTPGYPELFYGVLFHPIATFKALAEQEPTPRTLLYALLSVILISAASPVIHFANFSGKPVSLAVIIPLSAIMGVVSWLFVALVIAMLSYAFCGKTRFRTFLTLSGLAVLPWLLLAPISLLKVGLGTAGVILFAILALTIWLWSVLLFAWAIVSVYSMSIERVMIVLAMPFAMTFIFFAWSFGFFSNISNLVPR